MRIRNWLLLALLTMGAMLATILIQPVTWVQATTDDGTRLACARVDADTPITLVFTHSMYGGFVAEDYQLRADGVLERQRMTTENAAAAEYYATDGQVRAGDDGYEVIAPPFSTDALAIRVDARGDHRLTIGARTWALYDMLGASTRVTLETRRSPRWNVPNGCFAAASQDITSSRIDLAENRGIHDR